MKTNKPAHTPEIIFATSHSADFQEGTYTFQPDRDFKVKAGRFAILLDSDYHELKSQRDELLAALKGVKQYMDRKIAVGPPFSPEDEARWKAANTAIANAEKGGQQ